MSLRPYVQLYNFAEKRVDHVFSLDSAEEAKKYLPQDNALHAQLDDYLSAGNSIMEALAFCIEDYYTAAYQELADWYNEKGNDNEYDR